MVDPPVTVLVADDEAMTRTALVALLALEPDIDVVADVGDGAAAVASALALRPRVAVVDLQMPLLDGIGVTERLSPTGVAVIIVTRHAKPGVLRRALDARAAGFVSKSTPAGKLADVIRTVAEGGRFVDSEIAARALVEQDCPLSQRELDVLRAALSGARAADIATELHLAPGTVRNYLSSAMSTLGARTRHEAARMAVEEGWL